MVRNAYNVPTQPCVLFNSGFGARAPNADGSPLQPRKDSPTASYFKFLDHYIDSGFSVGVLDMDYALWSLDHLYNYSTTYFLADKALPKFEHHPGPHHHHLTAEMVAASILTLWVDVLR